MEMRSAAGPMPVLDQSIRAAIARSAGQSALARYRWRDRGRAPTGYVKGMAIAYGQCYAALSQGDPFAGQIAEAARPGARGDVLNWYARQFAEQSMDVGVSGSATLRHLFVLLTGLGMRESAGRACEGRDRSASNTTAETAEAGLFQSSYNLHSAHPLIDQAIAAYAQSEELLDVFMEGVEPEPADLENFGSGPGMEFQLRTKRCPLLAVLVAALGLRHRYRHWGPIQRREAELSGLCDQLLRDVEALVDGRGGAGGTTRRKSNRKRTGDVEALQDLLDAAAEKKAWEAMLKTVDILKVMRFWNDKLQLRASAGQAAPLTKAELARLTTTIRAMSWVESRHGTGIGNRPERDPVQCGNEADSWWKSLNQSGATGDRLIGGPGAGNYYAGQLFDAINPALRAYPGLEKADTAILAAKTKGHDDPGFNPVMSYAWAVPCLVHKMNAVAPPGRKTYQCHPLNRAALVLGASRYNGGGNADYGKEVASVLDMLGDADTSTPGRSLDEPGAGGSFAFRDWNPGVVALPVKSGTLRLESVSGRPSVDIGARGMRVGGDVLRVRLRPGCQELLLDVECDGATLSVEVRDRTGQVLYGAPIAHDRQFVFVSQDELGNVLLWSDGEATIRQLEAR